jgi:N-acetylglucosaminyldiphosphoundecaprenol N-acetyl-beta-D-mannosaminyltransferase
VRTDETEDILGYRVSRGDRARCIDSIADWIANGDRCRWLACLNPHSHVTSLSDDLFSRALHDADWLIPDGTGIVLASRLLGRGLGERVTGSDIFSGVHERLNRVGGASVFFLGSTEDALKKIRVRMARDYPNVSVAGTYSPPFKPVFTDEENERMVATINAAAPDILWVGMTAPKQEKWIYRNRNRLDVKFVGAVGAVFDFFAGTRKRSPEWAQRVGLEWLPRLIREPRRLWRRNFISTPVFFYKILLQKVGAYGDRSN